METLIAQPHASATPDGLPSTVQVVPVLSLKSTAEEGLYLGVNLAAGTRVLAYDTRTDNGTPAGSYLFDTLAALNTLPSNPLMEALHTWCAGNNTEVLADVTFHLGDTPLIDAVYKTLFEPRIVAYDVSLLEVVTQLQRTTTTLRLPAGLTHDEVLAYAIEARRKQQGDWASSYVMNAAPTVLLEERPDLSVPEQVATPTVQLTSRQAAQTVEA